MVTRFYQLPVNEIWPVGTRVCCDFHRGIPATIIEALPNGGFIYRLDRPHDLGPRHGRITGGTTQTREGWRLLSSVAQEQRSAG